MPRSSLSIFRKNGAFLRHKPGVREARLRSFPTNENARNPKVSGAFIMTISQCSSISILSSAFGQRLACAGCCVLGFCCRPTSNFHRRSVFRRCQRTGLRLASAINLRRCRPTYFRFSPAICFQLCLLLPFDLRRWLASVSAFN